MYSLDDPKVERFLTDWFSFGEYQFGQYRNQTYNDLDSYKYFIIKCFAKREPAFVSIQPKLKIVNLFFEFDAPVEAKEYSYDMEELDDVWLQTLMIVNKLKSLDAKPLIFWSGRRGYHVYAHVFDRTFKADEEPRVRKFYKNMIYSVIGDGKLYPNFDKLPTHINAMARMPFSYHQKTGKQVIPLTEERNPYIPDLYDDFLAYPLKREWILENLNKAVYKTEENEIDLKDFNNFKVRPCIMDAMKLNPEHETRLAFLLDAIYAGMKDEEIHTLFRLLCEDYDKRKTQYQIDYSRNSVKAGVKPCSCATLKEWKICNKSCRKENLPWST